MKIILKNQQETENLGQRLARCYQSDGIIIYLLGDLGAGKTTLARGFIQYFGFAKVKSPTYSIIESYQNDSINIHHLDCYRLKNPAELDYIGIRDYQDNSPILLIEWAKLGGNFIPPADLTVNFMENGEFRNIKITAETKVGEKLLDCC